jgi:hypothetical protein
MDFVRKVAPQLFDLIDFAVDGLKTDEGFQLFADRRFRCSGGHIV